MALLYLSTPKRAAVWQKVFADVGEEMVIGEDAVKDPAAITHIACWYPPVDIARYPNLRVVISVGAGVDQIPALPGGVQLSRTVSSQIDRMVREWVVMATLMLHRGMATYIDQAARQVWQAHAGTAMRETTVGIMGTGRVGLPVARTLIDLGFNVCGWNRSGRPVEGMPVYGERDLDRFLGQTNLLICLLPLTDQTRGLMSSTFFEKLPIRSRLVHAGRGAQLDMDALHAALQEGRIESAMLDVTNPEPLPQGHWAWSDPRVIITPHIGSVTDYEEGARHVLAVIKADRDGCEIPGRVDQNLGY
ncbi:glyoxylate/hydroxypyruvate reductase A [Thalassospira sp. TSL5-1]|uniref:2-hydroxyacid dehydrogenase n=1 Tax=Thalassospira sp. TSL5-1 TaxID=1544451 RepID=UPI00093BFA55|nr:glyoxylate/hydroxypyruvate reductase A [Thalassospira sp. TSL5-1]OKH87201.1 3-phosphoglycerate dehydrogenase [Thalassospira sp. TSL5-1]